MNKPLTRAEVAPETTWDLADLFATRDAWLAELAAVERSVASVVQHQGRLAGGPAALLACLDARDELLARLERVEAFAGLREAEDGGNPGHQADQSTAAALGARVHAALTFVDTEILDLPEGTLATWLREAPALGVYRPTLDRLAALRPHRLSAETERVLASLGEVLDAPYTIYGRAKTGDMTFAPFTDSGGTSHPNSFNLYQSTYETAADTSVRRAAWASFSAGLAPYQHTMGGTFAIEVAKNIVLAKARGHASAERYLLHEHQVPFELYTHVLDIIQAELAPHMRRYARLRRRVLGLDRLLYCDIKAPLDPGYAPATTFDDTAAAARGCARAARRRVRGAGAQRVQAPLDRPRRQRRQVVGRVLRHALRRAFVHPDDVDGLDARRVHARPRARPRGPLHAGGAAPAPRQHRPGDALRRGAVDHERGAAGAAHPGRLQPTRACAAGC